MLAYAARRLALAVPVVLCVVTLVFLVVRVLPGDPAQAALGENASSVAVDALRTRMGLDAPLPVQYVRFMSSLLRGDLGISMINSTSVRDQIAYNLPFTLHLTLAALIIGTLLGVPLGVYAAVHRDQTPDVLIRVLSLTGLCIPAFFLGILLILLFGVQLQWLPAVGGGSPQTPADFVAHLVLPALTLGLIMTASVTRLTRAAMLSVIANDYVRTARAKGLREHAVVLLHTLRPALLPIVSLTGVWAVALIGDSVTTEVVFSRPGLGKMMVGAMLQRDYTSIQSVMVVYTLFVVGINLVTDLAYGLVDPRIRN
ncbi:MAG TPA: ABC transporter permease [Chloroflexota bacterium]|jgi:ABC-type dipeptide/oligopeptide/nickel transport system permease component